jgi:hypothetical protein
VYSRILDQIRRQGFHYEPEFSSDRQGKAVVALARRLGPLFVPGDLSPDHPVIFTRPELEAPSWRPFDRPEAIGWHNDFSTVPDRPALTLIWIAEADPAGGGHGDWRVASVADLIASIEEESDGEELLQRLRNEEVPLGYDGTFELHRLLQPLNREEGLGLRFYGRALLEGADARFGRIPESTRRLVERIHRAADVLGRTLPARRGALLVVDNRRSLHDRTPQTPTGERRRSAVLCFVQQLA